MKNLIKSLVLGSVLLASAAFAGETVNVTWDMDTTDSVPYSGFKLFWTDVTGIEQTRVIPDPAARATTVLDVPFGNSTWYIRSLCDSCVQTESADSPTVSLDVKSKGVPSAPSLSISLGN